MQPVQSSTSSFRNRRRSITAHLFKLLYILVVLLIVNLALIASFYIIFDRELETFAQSFADYLATMPLMMVTALVYIDLFGMTHFFRKTRTDIFAASLRFVLLETMSAAAIAFALSYFTFPRRVMLLGAALMLVGITAWSWLCLHISKCIYSKGRIMIAAAGQSDADRLYVKLSRELKELHIDYLGYACVDPAAADAVLPLIDRCSEVLISAEVGEAAKSQIFLYCADRDKTVYIVPQFTDLVYTRFRVIHFHDIPAFMIDSLGLTFQERLLKRGFDILFALLALLVTLPVQLLIWLAVRLDSPGPALYSQDRITFEGRIYRVYKFRTMVQGAERRFGSFQSSPDDPRVTRVGHLLRRMHLDELPQFVNILKGDLAVVGPRSDRPTTIGAFESAIPGYSQRLKVKSGLTGLAQIYGKYDSSAEDKLRYDLMYIKNYSFLLDLKIILNSLGSLWPSKEQFVDPGSAAANHPIEPAVAPATQATPEPPEPADS
jgi:exopolysaccharide biosynthesis polyprenyl glycosylphosphotransferase